MIISIRELHAILTEAFKAGRLAGKNDIEIDPAIWAIDKLEKAFDKADERNG